MPGFSYDAGSVVATADIDRTLFNNALTQMQKDAAAFAGQTFTVGFNAELNQASVAQIESELAAVTAPRSVKIEVDGGSLSALALGIQHSLEQALGGGAVAAIVGTGGGGAGGMGLIGALLWGGGGILGFGAGFGSIMSLAGFGIEHLVTTILGLAGSLAGALAGGALLAAGAMSILAVGMGSDMMVSMSAIADTKTLGTAYAAIQTAILQYGVGSAQAAAATANLNLQMQLLGNTAGVLAELQLAMAISALNSYWDQATSGARVAFVGMVTPLLAIAYTYIPLVAAAATRNFGIITTALQPLIAFLDGPATAVFQELENIFAIRLPMAMSAFNQGIQFLISALGYLAGWTTGNLMTALNSFFTYLNTPTGFAKFESAVGTLVGMFQVWWAFGKQLFITLVDIFGLSKGLGTGIIETLTSMLKGLDKWLTETGKSSVATLFATHKTEVIELLKALGDLLAAFAVFYLAAAPFFIRAATGVLTVLASLFSLLAKNPVVAFVAGLALVSLKLIGFRTVIGGIGSLFGGLGGILDALLGPIGLVILAIIGIGVILVESYIHFAAFRDFVNNVWSSIVQGLTNFVGWVQQLVGGLGTWLHTHWAQIADDASISWNIVSTAIKIAWEVITTIISWALAVIVPILSVAWSVIFNAVTIAWTIITSTIRLAVLAIIAAVGLISGVIGFLTGVWQTVTSDIHTAWDAVTNWFQGLPGRIVSAIGTATNILFQVGKDIITGLWNGITSVAGWLQSKIAGLAGSVVGWAKAALGISSPSKVFMVIGESIPQGLALGITGSSGLPIAATQAMVGKVAGVGQGGSGAGGQASGGWAEVAAEVRALGDKIDRLPHKYRAILRAT